MFFKFNLYVCFSVETIAYVRTSEPPLETLRAAGCDYSRSHSASTRIYERLARGAYHCACQTAHVPVVVSRHFLPLTVHLSSQPQSDAQFLWITTDSRACCMIYTMNEWMNEWINDWMRYLHCESKSPTTFFVNNFAKCWSISKFFHHWIQ